MKMNLSLFFLITETVESIEHDPELTTYCY